ncbi:Fe-S oxidoreductase [Sporosarcina sp. P37]|uniref:(Fe-S)-binding protein n=1 Tax=unclassified Sporosarcina TaxID=2647733 RepID=UPI0009BF1DA2|nr:MULTISPECIES: (Fe-S)-binding protein [unclassified Sporosarcina]ARD47840.1 Fe-S oxidoreductase [Sporosarcina sp. P33]ARK24368.1 Fe-S oxidoreductase [Sporosarcina sp. P37]PID17447.1 (Fe-S)-binding protein [Sporosarcina sp. P35]
MKVSLFITCLVDMFYAETGKDMAEVLEKQGCELSFPKGQVCCGQPAYNSGYVESSKSAMKNMIKAFEGADYVVTPSGSCAAMFKLYPDVFKDDPKWLPRAQELADKTYEFTQFLVNVLKTENVGAKLTGKATYHPSCHMTRLLGAKEEPGKLLAQVEGLEMIPLPNAHNCCGFGGTFSVKMGDISEQMVDEKVNSAIMTEADYVIGADCGCLMNIGGRAERSGKPIRVMHIAQVLNSHE